MMPVFKKAFDFTGDDIVELSTEYKTLEIKEDLTMKNSSRSLKQSY